jgi:hypothetical protein
MIDLYRSDTPACIVAERYGVGVRLVRRLLYAHGVPSPSNGKVSAVRRPGGDGVARSVEPPTEHRSILQCWAARLGNCGAQSR